ncbi:LysR family transcriptional regulator [Thalassovita sp.]|uniref:LysR family transcriptional regulator n=1 Tax=Thalassovita sp. TaxID=1979401 RepID=UPI002AB1DFF2|nr:LysR family transcriptional regulator [Thalassovita sp.]
MTNLNHLHVVSTVCDLGSFQLASEKLNKARPAVSYAVKQVEDFYQIQIFDRSEYRPKLTAEGKLLLTRIRRLLDHAQEFEAYVQDLKGEVEGELKLAVSSVFPPDQLSSLLNDLRHTFPSTTIHLEFEVGAGERLLLADTVDLAICVVASRHGALDYLQLETMEMPLVIKSDQVTVPAAEVTRDMLLSLPQIVVKSPDEQSPDAGLLEQSQKWFVTELGAKRDLICAGLGWGRLPKHMVDAELSDGTLVALPTLGQISLPVCLAKRARYPLGPVGRHIWDSLQQQV